MKTKKNVLSIILVFSLFSIALEQGETIYAFDKDKNIKSISIGDNIVYISNRATNNTVNIIKKEISSYHEDVIKYNKDILKKSDSSFIIIGTNQENTNPCYEVFSIENNSIKKEKGKNGCIGSIYFPSLYKMEGRYIKENKIILSTIDSRKFYCYMIHFTNDSYDKFERSPEIVELPSEYETSILTSYIKCDSYDGFYFFCIYYYKTTESWIMKYSYGLFNFTNTRIIYSENICSDMICSFGNLLKVKESNKDKYLICYIKMDFSTDKIINTVCQYFYYENGKMNREKNYDLWKDSDKSHINKPIIFYLFDETIFFILDCKTQNMHYSKIILISPNLELSIQNNIHYIEFPFESINLINNNKTIYYLFALDQAYCKERNLINAFNGNKHISLSNSNNYTYNFTSYFENQNLVEFAFDKNLMIYKNGEQMSHRDSMDLTTLSATTFTMKKKDIAGVFYNYFCFGNSRNEGRYQDFSLIKKVTVTICYDSCKSCNERQAGNFDDNLCNSCISNYHPIIYEYNRDNTKYNCYNSSDQRIMYYYLNKIDNKYYDCTPTCKTCANATQCKYCKDNFYFLLDNITVSGLCNEEKEKDGYYLDSKVNIPLNIENENIYITTVYKKCYDSCSTCKEGGNETNHNCETCKKGVEKYPFSQSQCLKNQTYCLKNNQFWEFSFEDNNIRCIENCSKAVILYGNNRGQCVDSCQDFDDPYLKVKNYFTIYNCNGFNYCVPLEKCLYGEKYGKFTIDYDTLTCNRTTSCNISFFDEDDPFKDDNVTDLITTVLFTEIQLNSTILTTIPIIPKDRKINWRIIDLNESYYNYSDFDPSLMDIYIDLHKKLTEKEENGLGIYLVLTINYIDFIINIYPLDKEDFVYSNILLSNNLGFINFREVFPSLEYELNQYTIVILLERICPNSAINELNYYFVLYEDNSYTFEMKDIYDLGMNETKIKVEYPLKNYDNNNSDLSERHTKYLVGNISNMYQKYPQIYLSNIDDPFYNDICFLYTSDVDTDMTLNDRREEYYINKSLCEANCTLKEVLDRDLKTIKSLCECDIKYNYTSNENAGIKDDIPHKNSYNIKSFLCIKETFNSENYSKNPVFWVLLIVLIFFILMILCYVFYGNKVLKRILKLNNGNLDLSNDVYSDNINKNSEIKIVEKEEIIKKRENKKKKDLMIMPKIDKEEKSLSKISKIEKQESIQSNENININLMMNNKNNKINKLEFSKLEQDKNVLPKSEIMSDKNKEKLEIIKKDKNSYKYNPPKRKEEKKNDSMITKTNNDEKDLISNDISLNKKINKGDDNSEISFDNLSKEKPVLIDNLINNGEILENNFLDYPLRFENNLILEMYRDALDLNDVEDKEEINQILFHCNTMEDYYIPETSQKNNEKFGQKKIKRKNPRVIKLLDGEDLFYPTEKNYESDNYYEKDYSKKMNKVIQPESGEDSLFGKLLIKKGQKQLIKKAIAKEKKKDLIEINKQQESENSEEKEKKLKEKRKRRINFLQSLTKKDSNKKEDSKYGKEEDYKNARLKTDFEEDAKNLVKSTLKYLGKEGLSYEDESSFSKNIKNKSFNSTLNDKNNLIISKSNLKLDNNLKSKNKKVFQFREEENIKSDKKNKKKKKVKRSIKNKKDIEIKESDEINIDYNKKSDFEIFYDKALGSSISSFLKTEGDGPIIEDNIFLYYWKYFKKRELFLVCFFDKKDSIPYFIRWSSFFFCLIFIFMLNCFFFFEKSVHKRYINALEGKSNNISFYFKNEFVYTIYVSLISIVFKMIIVKLVLNRVFKIKKKDKKMMHHSFEKKIQTTELDNLEQKRYDYLVLYHIKIIIFFVLLFILSLLIAYICISYGGVFKNSINAFFFGLLFSAIFSFIFCAVICFIIVGINKISRIFKNRCLLSTYVVLSTIY